MKAVGIKQFKAQLSSYIRLVKAGETVLVTEREEIVAELRPARRRLARTSDIEDLDEVLDELAAQRELERASIAKNAAWTWKVEGAGLPEGTASEILGELREDR